MSNPSSRVQAGSPQNGTVVAQEISYVVDDHGLVVDAERVDVKPAARDQVEKETVEQRRERLRSLGQKNRERQAEIEATEIARRSKLVRPANKELQFSWIPANRLFVPNTGTKGYQRPLNRRRSAIFAKKFDWGLFGALHVADRGDGYYAVWDGQHRLEAFLLLRGSRDTDEMLPCMVDLSIKTVAAEASRFDEGNRTQVKPSYADRWRPRLVSRDPVALELQAILDKNALRISDWSGNFEKGTIGSVSRLEAAYLMVGGGEAGNHLVDLIIRCLRGAWPDQPEAFRANLVLGMTNFLLRYRFDPNFREAQVIRSLSKFKGGPRALDMNAMGKATALQFTSGGESAPVTAYVIHGLYNSDLRDHRKLSEFVLGSCKSENSLITKKAIASYKADYERTHREKGAKKDS